MKKRISLWLALTVLTVALAAVLVACSSAEKKASEGLAFVSNGDGTCFVSGIGTCTDKNVRIPSVSPDGDIVTEIYSWAFMECTRLTSVTIPDSVTSIGGYAFTDCTSLTSIQVDENNPVYHSDGNCLIETATKTLVLGCKTSIIPTDGSVISIGKSAFFNCTSLTNITIPNSVTCIGDDAFRQCSSLTNITIPDSVNSIGYQAFSNCWHLTSITFYGTKAQWQAIEKGSRWTFDSRINTIHCTDGDIQI